MAAARAAAAPAVAREEVLVVVTAVTGRAQLETRRAVGAAMRLQASSCSDAEMLKEGSAALVALPSIAVAP